MRTVLATLALMAISGGDALAYGLKTTGDGQPIHWATMPIGFAVDAAGSRDLPLAEVERSVRGAFEAWGRVHGSAVSFRYDGARTGLKLGYDREEPDANRNTVIWSRDTWDFEPDALAVTLTLYRRSSGELVDADIVVNERAYTWGSGEVENDLQNAITHEIGHFLGFGHSEVRDATMFSSAGRFETKKRTLHDDDESAALRLYPSVAGRDLSTASTEGAAFRDDSVPPPADETPRGTVPEAPPSMGCAVARAPSGATALLALLLLGVRRRAHPEVR